jgi:hypothetical protein
MDQVLKLALEGSLPELQEETPEALAQVPPGAIEVPQTMPAHQ